MWNHNRGTLEPKKQTEQNKVMAVLFMNRHLQRQGSKGTLG